MHSHHVLHTVHPSLTFGLMTHIGLAFEEQWMALVVSLMRVCVPVAVLAGGERRRGRQAAQHRHQGHGRENAAAPELCQHPTQSRGHEPHHREQDPAVPPVAEPHGVLPARAGQQAGERAVRQQPGQQRLR